MPNLVSFSLVDKTGEKKAVTVFLKGTATLVQIQAEVNALASALDATTDAVVSEITLAYNLTKPAGLKSAALPGNTAREGALLTFGAAGTPYVHSIFVPAWKDSLFSGNAIVTTGASQTLYQAIVTGVGDPPPAPASDRYDNDLNAFIRGVRTFRK